MLSPQHHSFSSGHQSGGNLEHMFDEFVTDPPDDVGGRNEAAEALEDRGREEEEEQGRMFADEYLNHT